MLLSLALIESFYSLLDALHPYLPITAGLRTTGINKNIPTVELYQCGQWT